MGKRGLFIAAINVRHGHVSSIRWPRVTSIGVAPSLACDRIKCGGWMRRCTRYGDSGACGEEILSRMTSQGIWPNALLTRGLPMLRAVYAEGLIFKPRSPVMFLSSILSMVAFDHGAEGTPLRIVGCLELHFVGLGPFGPVGLD
ncbi:unnamed protein product [Cuscuta europaea]|uniref:Uncharacterized protein n=1 Tax=Cuscuta europaea TaxID=41803 RepID=A0A9P0ZIE3_CUSEU|nr:unnamed protein product [Cuscuta europaea]